MPLREQIEDIFKPATPQDVTSRQKEMKRREEAEAERQRQERIRQEQERKAREQQLKGTFAKVLKSLGYTKELSANDWGANVSARRDKDHQINLRFDNKRVEVSGTYPRGVNGKWITVYDEQGHEVPSPKITVSPDKSAEQMVIDIRRRFLPAYEKRMEYIKAQIQKDTQHEDLTAKNMRILKGKPVSDYERGKKQLSGYDVFPEGKYGNITVQGDDVSIEVSHLTVKETLNILRIIKGR